MGKELSAFVPTSTFSEVQEQIVHLKERKMMVALGNLKSSSLGSSNYL